jgi:hypothetical protein
MKKNLKRINKNYFLVLAFFVFAFTAAAQNFPDNRIQKSFISYQINNYNEKIFVHTDKTFYIAGESIWFKVYCVDENFHKPSGISKIAYVEIISDDNKSILQAKIALDSGSGNGSFIIPSFISSGKYLLRAYTKWMENFAADYFFETSVTIINTLKPGVIKNETKEKSYDINFFAEGGNLIEGITSKLAFKVVDEYGEPVDCSGTIVNENNNKITDFKSLKFGMGSFSFTPKTGEIYKAILKLADTTITKELPFAYKEGFALHAENENDSLIKITVSANIKNEHAVYMLVHSQNVLKDFRQNNLSNGEAVFIINKNKLADGISTITIFNDEKQPVCERLYFKKPAAKLKIKTNADLQQYGLRKPVHISLTATDNSTLPQAADMSVSVFMIDSLQSADYTDILSYLLLSSELKGKIKSPEYYFTSNDKDADEAADNLMLTQGWRRFNWQDVLQNKKPYFEFIPEYEGLVVDGNISNKFNNLPVQNINVTLTAPGENFQLSGAKSDAAGNLFFNVKKFYGTDNIIIQADSNYKVNIASSYSDKFSNQYFSSFKMPKEWKDQLLFRSINVQADNAYLINEKQHSYLYNAEDTSLFYGMPDKQYYLDDYTRFITMEEVMREYVAEVHVRKESEQFHFRAADFPTKTFFETDPLILLDGLPVTDASRIIAFDPLKIKRIDIVARKYYHGNMFANGIVSYATYQGDLADFPLNANEVVIKFDGLQREREFYSPQYDTEDKINNHLPDVRNVLYWLPTLKTNTDGKANFNFYTSDIPGKFACVIQGITPAGFAGSSIFTFDVSK